MKKKYILLFITILTTLIAITIYELKQNKKTTKEIKRLEQIIILKQEINKEYIYLLEETNKETASETIIDKMQKIENYKKTLKTLQEDIANTQIELQDIRNEIDETEKILNQIKIERRKKLEESTVKIEEEITYYQFPDYPTGCESIALYILLKYNNVETTPEEIVNRLKKGNLPYSIGNETYGGNPEIEFIGDPRNDYSYGVYNTPIAQVAEIFKEGVQNSQGLELEEILEIVSQNRPVMVWTTIENIESMISDEWIYKPTGETIYWKANEHTVVIIGYNDNQVIVSDPYSGSIRKYNRESFKQHYNYLGKRAVYY